MIDREEPPDFCRSEQNGYRITRTHRRDDLEKSARPASRLGSTDAAKPSGGFLKIIPTGFSAAPACYASFPSCLWDSSITPLHHVSTEVRGFAVWLTRERISSNLRE